VIRLAFLTTDNREQNAWYHLEQPCFGTAMDALLQGLINLPQEIELHVISCAKRPMASPERLGPNAFFHQPIVNKLGWGRSAFLGCATAVRRHLARIEPDVVHAQGTERDCAVSMMLAPKVPRLLTIHGHMARISEITRARVPSYYWLASILERQAIRRADGIVALNSYTKNRVSLHAKRTWLAPNAVNPIFFGTRRQTEPGLAICIAGVHPWKRQVELMRMLDDAPSHERPARLVFIGEAGDDPYGQAFSEAVTARSGWCEHVESLDPVALRDWYGRAELLILPSIEDNCPMVLLEAMAAGLPIVAAAVGGIPELVREGRNGLLFNPLDRNSLRGALAHALPNPERLKEWGEAGTQIAHREHRPEVVATRHLAIYRDAIASFRRGN
jgi:glycosyltransferase involved in cell wall biosynthesis